MHSADSGPHLSKDKGNDCSLYSIRVMVEKETSSKPSQRPNDARAAFDNLFKD